MPQVRAALHMKPETFYGRPWSSQAGAGMQYTTYTGDCRRVSTWVRGSKSSLHVTNKRRRLIRPLPKDFAPLSHHHLQRGNTNTYVLRRSRHSPSPHRQDVDMCVPYNSNEVGQTSQLTPVFSPNSYEYACGFSTVTLF